MGSGKSSLVKWLCQQFELSPFFEPHDENPYLADFYGDMSRWAFNSQLFFLVRRYRIHRTIEDLDRAVVQDRTLYEDAEVFAQHLRDRDWATYTDLYSTLRRDLRPPDLMIYLRCGPKTLRKRIAMRGRAYEQAIPQAYLKSLDGLYEAWFARYDASPTLVLETDQMDYVTRLFDRHQLLETIRAQLR
jgi:deoxyadenosine/deoxycytidine kinase